MQLKAFIKNKAAEKHISAQLVMQNYMLERLLERIALSKYKYNFILKGGFLISAIVGLDSRATMDLDTTVKGFELTHEALRIIFEEICKVPVEDDIDFEIIGTVDIREIDEYPGIRVNLKANYPPVSIPLTVDVTTGDKITPREVEYTFAPLFDEKSISIMAYPVETVLAEKLETILSRGIANTRPRDFYDVYILWKLRGSQCSPATLRTALERTSEKRGSRALMAAYPAILANVLASEQMQGFWRKYQKDFSYASDISFEDTITAAKELMDELNWAS
jgi:predicted nucleotidyltransferase component of viral defense system